MDQLPVGYTVGGCLSVEAARGVYGRLHGNIAWGKIAPLSVSQGSNSGQVGLSAGNPGSKLGRASGPARLFYRGLLSSSEARRVGIGCVSTCSSRWSPSH